MPGWPTNGIPPIAPPIQNGATVSVGGISNNGTVTGGSGLSYSNLSSAAALIPADTEIAAGSPPQTVASSPFQIAAAAMALIQNTATSTVHTGTLNTQSGMMITEALTTASGANYTFQLVNSLITATGPIPQVQMHSVSNTGGAISVASISNATGTATCVFTNTGTAAWNGTMAIGFHV